MYDEAMLDELLTEYYDRTLLAIDNAPVHKFSRRHNRAMKRIFKLYEKNTKPLRKTAPSTLSENKTKRNVWHNRILLVAVIIFLALITGFTAAYFISKSFKGKEYSDNTWLFVIDTENCPSTIEKKYVPTFIPEGFALTERHSIPTHETMIYRNSDQLSSIIIDQWVKNEFNAHIDNKHGHIEKTEIYGCECLITEDIRDNNTYISLVLDSKDYVFNIEGVISKNEAINIARSIELEENVK